MGRRGFPRPVSLTAPVPPATYPTGPVGRPWEGPPTAPRPRRTASRAVSGTEPPRGSPSPGLRVGSVPEIRPPEAGQEVAVSREPSRARAPYARCRGVSWGGPRRPWSRAPTRPRSRDTPPRSQTGSGRISGRKPSWSSVRPVWGGLLGRPPPPESGGVSRLGSRDIPPRSWTGSGRISEAEGPRRSGLGPE